MTKTAIQTLPGPMDSKVTLGTVSHGTMRPEDLIPAFAAVLEDLATCDADKDLLTECEGWIKTLDEMEDPPESIYHKHMELGHELVMALMDYLNAYAPPYCYFGGTEGDGSDYGFWPSIDGLEDAARFDRDVIKIDAGDEPDYIMSVNDHGNVTLYRVTLEKVWDCV